MTTRQRSFLHAARASMPRKVCAKSQFWAYFVQFPGIICLIRAEALRASIDANWRWEWWLLEKDRAYESLWDEPEFKAMMDEIRADMARRAARDDRKRRDRSGTNKEQ